MSVEDVAIDSSILSCNLPGRQKHAPDTTLLENPPQVRSKGLECSSPHTTARLIDKLVKFYFFF